MNKLIKKVERAIKNKMYDIKVDGYTGSEQSYKEIAIAAVDAYESALKIENEELKVKIETLDLIIKIKDRYFNR